MQHHHSLVRYASGLATVPEPPAQGQELVPEHPQQEQNQKPLHVNASDAMQSSLAELKRFVLGPLQVKLR